MFRPSWILVPVLLTLGQAALALDLSKEQMVYIDAWLVARHLNAFGDPEGTVYTGGTPLIDSATGVQMDRYEHVLRKHPDLADEIAYVPGPERLARKHLSEGQGLLRDLGRQLRFEALSADGSRLDVLRRVLLALKHGF